MDLALFVGNGQWDPLVQLTLGAFLRASAAAVLAAALMLAGDVAPPWIAGGVAVAFLPHLAWHNALWGFQSQVYFTLLFSVISLALYAAPARSRFHLACAFIAAVAAQFAMGAGAFVPVAVLGLAGIRAAERRSWMEADWPAIASAVVLLCLALALRVQVPEHDALQTRSAANFLKTLSGIMAWPHSNGVLAALTLNAPSLFAVTTRMHRRRSSMPGEDFALLLVGWCWAGVIAVAALRGGGAEFSQAIPSRYVDFFILLPIANGWLAAALLLGVGKDRIQLANWGARAWGAFLFIGWLGLSAEMMRHIILPRARDTDAPVRLARAFQLSGNPAVFVGQPRLLIPHPNPESVRTVLTDPRMQGRLPPSLQPEKPMGSLSRSVRWLLGRRAHEALPPTEPSIGH